MKGKRLLAAAAQAFAVLFLSPLALATMSVPAGWYLEGNLGSAHLSNANFGHGSTFTSSGLGGNLNLGYKFMPYLGMEIGYSQYPTANVKDQFDNKAATDKFYSYDLAGRGIVPVVDSGFEIFAKLGVQRINSHISTVNQTAANNIGISNSHHNATGLYLGAGVQYYFLPELAFVVQWQSAQGNNNTGTQNLFSGGLSFIFD